MDFQEQRTLNHRSKMSHRKRFSLLYSQKEHDADWRRFHRPAYERRQPWHETNRPHFDRHADRNYFYQPYLANRAYNVKRNEENLEGEFPEFAGTSRFRFYQNRDPYFHNRMAADYGARQFGVWERDYRNVPSSHPPMPPPRVWF
jgi:hypothetical protein